MGRQETDGAEPSVVHHVRKHDVESWHNAICEVFCHTRYTPRPDDKFMGEMSFASHGGARMLKVRSSAGHFVRDRQTIQRDGFDSLVVLVSLRGDLQMVQNGNFLQARHGEALVYRHGSPFEIEFPHRYGAVSLRVDPDLVQRHCPSLLLQNATVIKPETTNGLLALTMVRELCVNAITKSTTDAHRLVGATLDVMSTIVSQPDTDRSTRNRWLLDKLEDLLQRNIDNGELSLESLARAAGVSARTLNRLFAERGTTPMRWVLDRRLELAYDVLAQRRVRNVTEAAFSFGFNDSSTFSRAFSRKFGVPPNSVLRRG